MKRGIIFLLVCMVFLGSFDDLFAVQVQNQYIQKLNQIDRKRQVQVSMKIEKIVNTKLKVILNRYSKEKRQKVLRYLHTAILKKISNSSNLYQKFILEEFRLQILKFREIKSIYNGAYSEHYKADSIEDILKNAENSYVLIDPFEKKYRENIGKIKENNNKVSCYISIGTTEKWRDDFKDLKKYGVTKEWEDWEGEYFIKNLDKNIVTIMQKRIDALASWGCDFVEFDNMDWTFDENYYKKYNGKVTQKDAILYYQNLCLYAKSKNLKCIAKNTVKEAHFFDGVLYESYTNEKNWWDTAATKQFLVAGKFVIINHYNEDFPEKVYKYYTDFYGENMYFISEDRKKRKYVHFNKDF